MSPTAVVFTSYLTGVAYTFDGVHSIISDIDGLRSAPKLTVSSMVIARQDGEKVTSSQYDKRTGTANGRLIGVSGSDLSSRLSALKLGVQGYGYLDVTYPGDVQKRYFIYVTSFLSPDKAYQISWIPFSFQFEADDPPFGEDLSFSSLYSNTNVTGNLSQTITTGGEANSNVEINFQYNSTGWPGYPGVGTAHTIELINQTTGDEMSLYWSPSQDNFFMSSAMRAVTVDGNSVSYDGNVLNFLPGSNALKLNLYKGDPFNTGSGASMNSSLSTYNDEQTVTYNGGSGQTWQANSSYTLTRIDALLYAVGVPGNLQWWLYSVQSDKQTLNSMLASGTLAPSNVFAVPTWVSIPIPSIALTNGDNYALILGNSTPNTADNAYFWKEWTNASFPNGYSFNAPTNAYTNTNGMCMRVWGGTPYISGVSATLSVKGKNRYL